jgi:hypothetical protein
LVPFLGLQPLDHSLSASKTPVEDIETLTERSPGGLLLGHGPKSCPFGHRSQSWHLGYGFPEPSQAGTHPRSSVPCTQVATAFDSKARPQQNHPYWFVSDNDSRELGRQHQWEGQQQDVASGSKAAMYAHISDQQGVGQCTHRESYATKKNHTKIPTLA